MPGLNLPLISPPKKQKKKEKNFLVLWPNTCWMGIVWRLDEDVLVVEILPPWKMYFDGAAHQDGAGVLFLTSEGEVLPHSFTLSKPCSNNLAEYQARILDLRWLWIWKSCNSYGDLKLVINQLLGNYSVKKPDLNWFHTIITQTKRKKALFSLMDHLVGLSGLRLLRDKPFWTQSPGFHGKVSKE